MKKSGWKIVGIGVFLLGAYLFLQAGGIMALYALGREESIASLGLSETVLYGIIAMVAGGVIYYKMK